MSVDQILEIAGVIFTLLNVYLLTKQRILAWPLGLVGVTIYTYIFFSAQLYSDFILHIIYMILNAYGWWYWSTGRQDTAEEIPVSVLSLKNRWKWIFTIIFGFLIWGYIMRTYTEAALPYPDAFTTVTSLAAQYLLARKKVENWILWIIVDVVAITIYSYKGLYPTSFLYTVLLVLSILGYISWQKSKDAASHETF